MRVLLSIACSILACRASPPAERPNILLIFEYVIDARALPAEKPADPQDPEAAAAKANLEAVFKTIRPDGPRPPVPFGNAAK